MKNMVLILLLIGVRGFAQVAVDGFYEDWESEEALVEEVGDASGLDLLRVYVSHDQENLFIRLDADREFDIQDSENISIYIDADNNPSTGFQINGIGSEITYYFGSRQGFINKDGSFIQVNHAMQGMIALPTITSNIFEISFKRRIESVLGVSEMNDEVLISIENGSSGDKIPNASGGISYKIEEKPNFTSDYTLQKKNPSLTRLMTYNILRDGFQEQGQKPHLEAVIKALNPDIIAFQEIYSTPLSSIQSFLNESLANADGSSWQYAKEGPDVVVFTRGIIEAHNNIDGNGVFLLNSKTGDDPLILYNVHLPCCDNDFNRQREIDKIMSVVRDKENASQVNFEYPDNAPLIITGDFNMVGDSQNLTSFLEGDIDSEIAFGPDFSPDWDGSNLEDANPYVTGFPSNYTWKSETSSYNPGKLDFIFYSGSVMTKENAFVLDSEYLSSQQLDDLNLNRLSTSFASDHLPVVADFSTGIKDIDMDGFTSDVDCNDFNANINPAAVEIVNNDIDENCDGIVVVIDEDQDGFNSDEDCNDMDASINPQALEIVNNDIDENCDGEAVIIDEDRDGFNSDEDCNDFDPDINPSMVEIINNDVDENCDGIAQVVDLDMDGFNSDEDCNDLDSLINPMAQEIPGNGIDEDCDGEDLLSTTVEIGISNLNITPNPASEVLNVKFSGVARRSVRVVNSSGVIFLQKKVESEAVEIVLSHLPDGIYFLSIFGQNHSPINKSFIKITR